MPKPVTTSVAILSLIAAIATGLAPMCLVEWLNRIGNTSENCDEWGGCFRAIGLLLFAVAIGISVYGVAKKQRYLVLASRITVGCFAVGLAVSRIPIPGICGMIVHSSLILLSLPIAMYAASLLRVTWDAVLKRGDPDQIRTGAILSFIAGAALPYGSLLNDKAGALYYAHMD